MATVYLHIGAPETANATLQGMLAGNYEQLRPIMRDLAQP